jgi:hypothetical protein
MKFMDIELFDKKYVYLEWSDELEGKDCILAKSYQDLKDFVNSGNADRIFKVNKGTEKPFTNHCAECDFCYFDPNLTVKKAWLEGKTVQYYSSFDKWEDLISAENCNIEEYLAFDWNKYKWRIKPIIKENEKYMESCDNKYILNMRKNGCFNLSISKYDVSNPIYFGDREKCEFVMNTVSKNFIRNNEKCAECNGFYCYECKELKKFIDNIKFTHRMTNRELSQWLAKGNGEMKINYFSFNAIKPTVYVSHSYLQGTENKEVESSIRIRDFGSDEWREPLIEI